MVVHCCCYYAHCTCSQQYGNDGRWVSLVNCTITVTELSLHVKLSSHWRWHGNILVLLGFAHQPPTSFSEISDSTHSQWFLSLDISTSNHGWFMFKSVLCAQFIIIHEYFLLHTISWLHASTAQAPIPALSWAQLSNSLFWHIIWALAMTTSFRTTNYIAYIACLLWDGEESELDWACTMHYFFALFVVVFEYLSPTL